MIVLSHVNDKKNHRVNLNYQELQEIPRVYSKNSPLTGVFRLLLYLVESIG